MVATPGTSYPAPLRKADRLRGRRDGEQRIPSLAEIRRQQERTEGTDRLTVGYQFVLLAELGEKLRELELEFLRAGRAAAAELARHDEQIDRAARQAARMVECLRVAEAPLTAEELLPRNPDEERWEERTVRNRREVARIRRIAHAREAAEQADRLVEGRRGERAETLRRHQEVAGPETRAHQLVELYQRRLAEYVSALAQYHPDGRTLYPLLSIPEIELPDWIARTAPAPTEPRSQV